MIKEVDIDLLQPHPKNEKIYGAENVQELANEIKESGWVKELVVTDFYGGYTIVSGHRRHKAAQLLSFDKLPCVVECFEAEWQVIDRLLRENDSREKTMWQKTNEYSEWKEVEKEAALWRMKQGGKGGLKKDPIDVSVDGESKPTEGVANLPHLEKGKSREKAAQKVGEKARRMDDAEKVKDYVQDIEQTSPERARLLKLALETGNVNGTKNLMYVIEEIEEEEAQEYADMINWQKSTVREILKKHQQKKNKEERIKNNKLLSEQAADLQKDKKYRVIYADPPWMYNDKQNHDGLGGAEKHYPTLSITELCDLPIQDICEENAVLFLWTTSPLLENSFKVINSWGFKYKSSFVWDKVKHNMGHYNSVRHEFLLICTKGSATPDNVKLFDSVQSIERSNKHSEKPNEFRNIIETLYKAGNFIELFARQKHENWDVYGNEI